MASNLVVPLRVFSGFLNVSTTLTDRVWLFNIDTTKYDGTVTYKLCAVVRLSSGAQTGTVEIQPAGGGTAVGTVTHTGDTLNTRVEASFTPTAGDTAYTIFAGITGGATLNVFSVWIEVTQTGATKTQLDIPLLVTGGNVTGGPTEIVQSRPYLHTAANWSNATFQLVTVGHRGTSGTLTMDLFDGSTALASNVHNAGSNVVDRQVSAGFTPTNATEHVIRATASTGTDVLISACIRVTIDPIDKLEIHYQIGGRRASNAVDWDNAVTSTTVHCQAYRGIISTAGYTSGILSAAYLEAVALSAAASGDVIDLRKDGTNDSAAGGTSVTTVPNTSATKVRVRGSDILSGWANERYYAGNTKGGTAGTATGYFAAVIFTVVVPSGGQSIAIGIASETDSALSITPSKSLAIGIASETDSALALTAGHVAAIGIASETDSAQSLNPSKAATLGLASETDTALPIVTSKSAALGIASETDTAASITPSKSHAIGIAEETDTALSISLLVSGSIGTAEETDSALPIVASKSGAIGQASETDTALPLTAGKRLALGLAEETDTALDIAGATQGGQTVAIGVATETDTALSLTPSKAKAIGLAVETDTALSISPMKAVGLGIALETDSAFAMVAGKSQTLGLANELDTALAMTVSGGAPLIIFGPTHMTGIYVTRSSMSGMGVRRSRMTGIIVKPEGS